MSLLPHWTRRRFVASSAAATLLTTRRGLLHGQAMQRPQSAGTSPEEIAGVVRGLMDGHTARPLRYTPRDGGFLIRNGTEFFNRPLYGPNNAFRVDCGDLPEFSLYLPGHGGNLRLGIATASSGKWMFQMAEVEAFYRAGRMQYEVRDPLLGKSAVRVEVMTQGEGSGILVRVESANVPDELKLTWAFGGVSGRKGKRGGDIGCEIEPVTRFFQVRPEECKGNRYEVIGNVAKLHSPTADLQLYFPDGSQMHVADGSMWNASWTKLAASASADAALPILIGSTPWQRQPMYLSIDRQSGTVPQQIEASYHARREQLDRVAARLDVATSDPFVDALGPALATAGDAIWDDAQRCVMHGAVAWRSALAGWRGPYVLDAVGWHDRFREHARHWIAKQNRGPIITSNPATGHPDPGAHLARAENLLHSQGDLSKNHYDMNLVFFDAVLRHLKWTGDLEFAREIWPALKMHLAWEQRLFRRTWKSASGRELPLYEAYACIWASDNLQYNGGGAAHSTAYNFFANREAARLARLLGEDDAPYEAEAASILEGMHQLLWLPDQGTYGESKDLLGPETVYTSPALWTIYHTIDSQVTTPREAWQMCAERLAMLRAVPVEGLGVPRGGAMLSCSDWIPYEWSLNLLLLAENMHMALSLWQAGMAEDAFQIFKGNLLDSMFMGLTPGNFHMTSQLDAHRQEAQRDFGDPIGCTARALVEGLFGVSPDLLGGVLHLRPGFPIEWSQASLGHPDFNLSWRRIGVTESLEVTPRFARPLALRVMLRASRTGHPTVRVNGAVVQAAWSVEAIGSPVLQLESPPASVWKIEVEWSGAALERPPANRTYSMGDAVVEAAATVDDPQGALRGGRAAKEGVHTVFARRQNGACSWWLPITFHVLQPKPLPVSRYRTARVEPLDLSAVLTGNISEIFSRSYAAPRSPYCSLSIPETGTGGWANFDRQPKIDDTGLRALGGTLISGELQFRTPSSSANCMFLSFWQQDRSALTLPLTGSAHTLSLLLAGTTQPQCSRMVHAQIGVRYTDGTDTTLDLRNPENWWPIEQDYLIDDYLFRDIAPPPTRVDLQTGMVRVLDLASFKGRGREVPGGAANLIHLPLDPGRKLAAMKIEVKLYGVVIALLAATLSRT
ncbi:DUF4450 domain-containing protein [Granulicella sp. dw_53]|uniref:DUF4450 domain-containing protein n=1 Tax=Granulicella sp. dw_53 TaxID=2719792 RepID=UPI001BD2C338|nr:DUF4450 domain-containing protein [Granulicella sp. dw_53]